MYLKSLEMIGFKSFADKTRLDFEPGMTSIVGPNGCGKSNVSDAIRWVLGEQSAKALRGSKMEDVIFNGTDLHKALGMAEVSMTLANCESALGMEFNEVTVTRRVLRSGEGQYFINKAPCRLKDIQRLFMDTGIGTNSYSLMEQGKIDRILSSHPEDRREVFEEASGITKFKSDKREAMRKLDQTEANLLRLADIVREVRRQIISLQRQAGKARRYQTLMEQLRSFDIYASRERLAQLEQEITTLEARLSSITEQEEAVRMDISSRETAATEQREHLDGLEQKISSTLEASIQARTELDRLRELIHNNEDRVKELQSLSERDTRDSDDARERLNLHQNDATQVGENLAAAEKERNESETALARHNEQLTSAQTLFDESGKLIHRLRTEQLDLDVRIAQLQQELSQLEASERTNIVRRERLAAELAEAQRNQELFQSRSTDADQVCATFATEGQRAQTQLEALISQQNDKGQAIAGLQKQVATIQMQSAAKQAQIDLLQMSRAQREGFPDGARYVLDSASVLPVDRSLVHGPLADMLRAEPEYHVALEAALRPWMDAIVVANDGAARALIDDLRQSGRGAARLVHPGLSTNVSTSGLPGVRLADHVHGTDAARPLIEQFLGHVLVVGDSSEVPQPIPAGLIFVTRDGALFSGEGWTELWKQDAGQSNPIARQQLLSRWSDEASDLNERQMAAEGALATIRSEEQSMAGAIAESRTALDEARRKLATAEGERQVIRRESKEAIDRVETVSWEIKSLGEQNHSGDERRAAIARDIETRRQRQAEIRDIVSAKTEEMRDLEQQRSKALAETTECRVRYSSSRQQVEHLGQRKHHLSVRMEELMALIDERSRGISTYHQRIADLQRSCETAHAQLQPLTEKATTLQQECDNMRRQKETEAAGYQSLEKALREIRNHLEQVRQRKTQCEVETAEQKLRRQTLVDRVCSDYRTTIEAVKSAEDPVWENGVKPDRDALETLIAELRTKIEAMGPVNLVAIDEHRELEERLAFLTTQQDDLVGSKQQLLDMIKQINATTTELFSKTFEAVNAHFQAMFTKLFGGGTAKLVLVDEGDVLESGIEIIARPPGKKLQTVSLLSGGERTMTAVALLFSLYQVKPSPFCVLDELDAALDEANIGRFVATVKGFVERSQFIVITHNRQTIAASGTLYGVTMEKQGVSKIVSVRFSDVERPTSPAAETAAAN